jgi:hypothetical protein
MIRKMDENSFIFIQSGLTIENCRASIVYQDFRTDIPSKNVSLYAIYQFLIQSQILPAEAIILAVTSSKIGEKTDIGKLFRIVLPDSSGKV